MADGIRDRQVGPGWLAAAGAVVLAVGLGLAFLSRDDAEPTDARLVVVAGTVAVLGAVAWRVRAEGSVVGSATAPSTWGTLAAVGVVDLAAGIAVTGWLALLGVVLIAVALASAGLQLAGLPEGAPRSVLAAGHQVGLLGGPGGVDRAPLTGTIQPIGRGLVRVVAVAPDGRWDAELAGITLADETDPSWSAPISRGPQAWSPLSGPRAGRSPRSRSTG